MNTAIAEDGLASLSRDPYLALSLEGIRLIEASAGTGKTFTLATLFTRLVVEQGLRIGQILAVTFTDAATQELRKRIRERLALAARLVDLEAADGEAPEVRLTRDVLQRHLQGGTESAAALKRRLQVAADEIDLASIFTIHGFCTRVLREHALESGHTFDPPELLASDRELLEELAADLWRVHANDPVTLEPLTWLWSSPGALAADLRALLGTPPLHPLPRPTALADPRPALQSAAEALSASVREHGEQFFIDLCDAVDNKWLNGVSYKLGWLHPLGRQLLAWAERADPRELLASDRLPALLPEVLADKTNKKFPDRTPSSPLQAPLARYVALLAERDAWLRGTALDFLHTLRAEATQRLQALKRTRRVQTYDDLIDGVALALEGPQRLTLVRQLRAQYRIALVDEFQDTDDRQWGIFHTVFGDSPEVRELGLAPALFLIGDPKQAIYGFRGGDIHTYLKAKQVAQQAPVLDQNFRSRPSVLRALQALYDNGGEDAFLERDIRFEPVRPGGVRSDADYLRDGQAAKALTLRVLRSGGDKAMSADASRDAATQACVAAIHQILVDARAGNAVLRGRPVQPGDIAVLVRSHREATLVQRALAAVGIPAVAAGKQSLFATAEARDLRALLLALLQPADEGRLRAALATVLLGQRASAIAAMEREGDLQRGFQAQLLHWRERWQRGGPFAVIADVCAAQGERLLALIDGERRLTNYLQLGELLQEASAQALGMHGLLDWLQGQMASADQDDEQQLLRLESDARRVQIITLHKSKGLEYPLVFLPFVGIDGGAPNTASHCTVHFGGQRQLHWKLDKDEAWEAANAQREREQRAEDARLLYVGLTRAEHALWIAVGDLAGLGRTRLAPLLGDLQALRAHADVHIDDSEAPAALPQLAPEVEGDLPAVRALTRRVPHDWWVYSFTQLAHADAGAGSDIEAAATELPAPAADEPAGPELPLEPALPEPAAVVEDSAPIDPRFMGSRFGNVLHEAMENVDFAAWGDWQPGREAPEGQADVLRKALHDEGYADVDLDDGVPVLVPLVGHTLTVPLPEGGALYSLGEGERRAEIDFHFAIEPTTVPALLQVLHAHGVSSGRRGFGQRRRLEGLMTGMIDLTYVRDGRWYVLDYKSNRLPGYSPDLLAIAMRHSEYDLQALIYTVALHRWLRFRLGAAYDYERDMGGIRYLFCRGLDGTGNGVHVDRFRWRWWMHWMRCSPVANRPRPNWPHVPVGPAHEPAEGTAPEGPAAHPRPRVGDQPDAAARRHAGERGAGGRAGLAGGGAGPRRLRSGAAAAPAGRGARVARRAGLAGTTARIALGGYTRAGRRHRRGCAAGAGERPALPAPLPRVRTAVGRRAAAHRPASAAGTGHGRAGTVVRAAVPAGIGQRRSPGPCRRRDPAPSAGAGDWRPRHRQDHHHRAPVAAVGGAGAACRPAAARSGAGRAYRTRRRAHGREPASGRAAPAGERRGPGAVRGIAQYRHHPASPARRDPGFAALPPPRRQPAAGGRGGGRRSLDDRSADDGQAGRRDRQRHPPDPAWRPRSVALGRSR